MYKKNVTLKAVPIFLIISIVSILVYKFAFVNKTNFEMIQDYINSYGSFAALIYIAIFAIRTIFIVFPYSIMVILSGSLFGPVEGFLYSMAAVFVSASLAFFASKLLGKNFIEKLIGYKSYQLDSKIEEHGFKLVLLMRISTIFPFDIMNYAAGMTKVSYKSFITATLLGILPETFSLNYLGVGLKKPFSLTFFLSVAMVVLTVVVPMAVKKINKKKNA